MKNKLIVVTGGTKGIGRAIIEKYAEHQFDIVTCSRSVADLEALRSDIAGKFPKCKVHTFSADLSKREEVTDFANFIKNLKRDIDVLVNNTGVFIPGQVHNEPEGTLEMMIDTNLYSAYHLSRAIIPSMIAAKNGHIINICSIASITAYANGGSYCISKFAMYGMSKVLREELKPHGIRVTSVLPGATYTASWESSDLPEERFIKASDVADSVYSLHSLSSNTVIEDLVIRPQLGDI
jgi:short-subunit dehydrogenase